MRENDRALRKVGRDLERDKLQLEREEKKIVSFRSKLYFINTVRLI